MGKERLMNWSPVMQNCSVGDNQGYAQWDHPMPDIMAPPHYGLCPANALVINIGKVAALVIN